MKCVAENSEWDSWHHLRILGVIHKQQHPYIKKWSFQEAEEAEADEPLVNYEDIAAEQAQSTA